MNIEELKKIVRGNGFQESHGSTTMVIDVETVVDLLDELKQCDIPVVVGSLITADDEGTYFVVNTDQLHEIEKGSVVYLLNTYPEDIHLFKDKNGDEVWIDADDVDRK